jgi:hypothetical protein
MEFVRRLAEIQERSEKRHRPYPRASTTLAIAFLVLAGIAVVLLAIPQHRGGSTPTWLLWLLLLAWISQAPRLVLACET